MEIVKNELKKVAIKKGEAFAYMDDRKFVKVEDGNDRYIISRGGNAHDRQHRWRNYRRWIRRGRWSSAAFAAGKAEAYGHKVERWTEPSPKYLPVEEPKSWAAYQREWRKTEQK